MDDENDYEQKSRDFLTVLTTEREESLASKSTISVGPIRSVSDEDWVENYWRKNKNGGPYLPANKFVLKKAMVNMAGAVKKHRIDGLDRLNI